MPGCANAEPFAQDGQLARLGQSADRRKRPPKAVFRERPTAVMLGEWGRRGTRKSC
jgi:hypothetical protein